MSTGIEWTDETWNPVVGCTKVSQGCKFCYAKTLHDRRHAAHLAGKQVAPQYAHPFETVQLKPERLSTPLSWRKPRRVFVNSVSDLFHEDVPFDFMFSVWSIMAQAERHTFQVLTKRPARMLEFFEEYVPEACSGEQPAPVWPLPNVWLGVSVENQAAADERIPLLLKTPAAVRFLSCEPLLGAVDLVQSFALAPRDEGFCSPGQMLCADPLCRRHSNHFAYEHSCRWSKVDNCGAPRNIDWVIVGGESGGEKVRPMSEDWARSLRDQCVAAGVPFFFKQWGDWLPLSSADEASQYPGCPITDDHRFVRVGKKGRLLDGREWNEFPPVTR